jgi:hypothetical protein
VLLGFQKNARFSSVEQGKSSTGVVPTSPGDRMEFTFRVAAITIKSVLLVQLPQHPSWMGGFSSPPRVRIEPICQLRSGAIWFVPSICTYILVSLL